LSSSGSPPRLKNPSKDPPAALTPDAVGCRLFPIEDLARATGVSRRVMNRMLRDAGIAVVRGRRTNFVSLAEFEEKLPVVWDSIVYVDALQRTYDGDDA
jgi:hypothetical protein